MDWLDEHLGLYAKPDNVMIVGAGEARHLGVLMATGDATLTLVEPEPLLAANLLHLSENLDNVSVLNCALSDVDGQAELNVYEFSELNTLYPEIEAFSLLPGASSTSRVTVETKTLPGLVEQAAIPAAGYNWLIIETPGLEQAALSGLSALADGPYFNHVVLSFGNESSDQRKIDFSDLLLNFSELGYQMICDVDTEESTWPRIHLQHFPEVSRLHLARSELSSQIQSLENLNSELQETTKENDLRIQSH